MRTNLDSHFTDSNSINFFKIFTTTVAPGPPGQPTASDINATSMIIHWTPPKSNGGAPITSYIIEKKDQSPSSEWEQVTTNEVPGDNHQVEVTGLKTGSTYEFQVKANNEAGVGESSPVSKKYTACGKFVILMAHFRVTFVTDKKSGKFHV